MNQIVKRLAALAAAATSVLCLVLPVSAQNPTPGNPPTPAQLQQMLKKQMAQQEQMFSSQLGVTAAQRPKVHLAFTHMTTQTLAIYTKYMPATNAMMKKLGKNPTPEQRKKVTAEMLPIQKEVQPQMMKVMTTFQKELMGALTPAQQAKLKSMGSAPRPRQ